MFHSSVNPFSLTWKLSQKIRPNKPHPFSAGQTLVLAVEKKGSDCPNRKGLRKVFAQRAEISLKFKSSPYKLHFISLVPLKHRTIIEVFAKFRNDNLFLPTCQPVCRLCAFQRVAVGWMLTVIWSLLACYHPHSSVPVGGHLILYTDSFLFEGINQNTLFWHSNVLVLFNIWQSWIIKRIKHDVLNKTSSHANTLKLCYIFSHLWIGLSFFYLQPHRKAVEEQINHKCPGFSYLPHDKSSCSVQNPLDLKILFSLSLCYLISLSNVLF